MEDLNVWQTNFKRCYYSDRLINTITLLNNQIDTRNKVDLHEIKKAIFYCKKYHVNQKRLSGEPYYSHPLAVAELVAPYCFKTDILVTSILHDTIEDTSLTKDMIEYIFDSNIATKVYDLTRIKVEGKISSTEILKLLWLQKKKELLLVKYFDRLHNLQNLSSKTAIKQKKIILESLQDFLPLAVYLKLLTSEQQLSKICTHTNLILKGINFPKSYVFSVQDNFQPFSPTFQNELAHMYIRKVLET